MLEDENGKVVESVSVVKEWRDWNGGYYWGIQSMFIAADYR